MEYKPKPVGRPKGSTKPKRRGRPKKYKYPGPGSKLRKIQYKVLNISPLTHQMLKELSMYYKVSMMGFVHKIIEAAFNKTLIEVEQKHKEQAEDYELHQQKIRQRRLERERAAQNSDKS